MGINFFVLRKKKKHQLRWQFKALAAFVCNSIELLKSRKKLINHTSPWWFFIYSWPKEKNKRLANFINGSYQFEPLQTYTMKDETLIVWAYEDRPFVRALLFIIKPVFKHIISSQCFHLRGPAGVKNSLSLAKKALELGKFRYFMRIDIKSYYASIDRKILLNQVYKYFKDLRVLNYLEQIINIPIIKDGNITTPTKGIHRRNSLSPFFGALYLSPLDMAFENSHGVFYLRFMDDILILTKTKRQFCRAKRRLQQILDALKLQLSKRKTKMGVLTEGFHFLGINFKVNLISSVVAETQNREVANDVTQEQGSLIKIVEAQTQQLKSHVSITLHERCCFRALDNVTIMKEDAVHPAKVQRYLSR